MRLSLHAVAVVALSVTVSACSAFGPGGPGVDPDPEPPSDTVLGYPAYETFDPEGYDADPVVATEVIHDVPARVMEGRVVIPDRDAPPPPSEPQARQVDGFRVQIFTSSSRAAAERVRGEAVTWWERAQNSPSAPRTLEAIVAYQQPYYRVRMGAFGTREDAEEALALVRQQYPEAFLVPDLVTVMQ